MDLRNSNGTLTVRPYRSFCSKISIRSGKCIMWNSIHVLPNQVSKKSFFSFEDIDLRESHAEGT